MKVWQESEDEWICSETIKGHTSTVWDACFEPKEGSYLISCSQDNSLILWKSTNLDKMPEEEMKRFEKVFVLSNAHSRSIYSVDWSKISNKIASGGADDTIKIFEAPMKDDAKSPCLNLLYSKEKAHSSDINCVKWHPNKSNLISCGDDHLVKFWKFN